jgi:hypothetical protein
LHDAPHTAGISCNLVATGVACVIAKLPSGDVNIVSAQLTVTEIKVAIRAVIGIVFSS